MLKLAFLDTRLRREGVSQHKGHACTWGWITTLARAARREALRRWQLARTRQCRCRTTCHPPRHPARAWRLSASPQKGYRLLLAHDAPSPPVPSGRRPTPHNARARVVCRPKRAAPDRRGAVPRGGEGTGGATKENFAPCPACARRARRAGWPQPCGHAGGQRKPGSSARKPYFRQAAEKVVRPGREIM